MPYADALAMPVCPTESAADCCNLSYKENTVGLLLATRHPPMSCGYIALV